MESIWMEYRSALRAFLLSKVSNPDDVDDLLQEVLIKTYSKLHTVRSEKSIRSWLFQVASRATIDFYRKRVDTSSLSEEGVWLSDEEPDVKKALSGCIGPFIQALPKESAELLTAVELNGQSQKVYAEQQGIHYSTLKSRLHKSRNSLRALLEGCCHLTLDSKGAVIDFEPKSAHCDIC